jgi:hypothetical protein
MAKHTPGPWFAMVDEIWSGGPVIREPGCFQILSSADTQRADVLCTRQPWPECADEMHANARLIAAAPDGLAAAQDALIALEAAPDTVTTRIARQKLRAFIAKATGTPLTPLRRAVSLLLLLRR